MNPLVSNITNDNSMLRFRLSGVNVSIANAVRRIMTAEISCVVFRTSPYSENKVDIEINTTRMNNELLKQRISCIPIHISDTEFPIGNYVVELDKSNNSDVIMFATTEDFNIKDVNTGKELSRTEVKRIFPPDKITGDYIDIARLRPKLSSETEGEHLKLIASFDIGTSKEDGSFGVVSTCAYAATPDQEIIGKQLSLLESELKSKGISKEDIEYEKKDWLLLKGQTYTLDDSFEFSVKSVGQFENMDIVFRAAHVMLSKLKKFKSDINSNSEMINKSDTTIPNSFDVTLEGEDYTLGKALEYVLYKQRYDPDGKVTHALQFCGFRKPHPHIDKSLIRLGFVEPTEKANVIGVLSDTAGELEKIFNKIAEDFKQN